MSFGKYDSDYSALKALAFAVGLTMPDGGWDSSYSIMSSMYEYLVGTAPAEGVSLMSMVDDIQTGVETGEIVIQDNCINEIERLNELVADLQNQLKNCGEGGGGGGSVTPSSDPFNDLFGVIGYNDENADVLYDKINSDIQYAENIMNNWDPALTIRTNQFQSNHDLVYFPLVDMSRTTNSASMFQDCTNLKFVPPMDTSSVTDMSGMFVNCPNLQNVTLLNTSKVESMAHLFRGCSSLTTIPPMDTSSVTDMGRMFYGCSSLTTIPPMDTSSVTAMLYMFQGCSSLTTIPPMDTSSVTDMTYMFDGCSSLTTIPQLDTSKATNMSGFFANCSSLTTIPQLDTSSATNLSNMFNKCKKLESLPLLNVSDATNISTFFGYSDITTLTELGGFTGLKIDWTGNGSLRVLRNLTVQSLLNVFNTIADVTDLGGKKLEIGTTNLNKLTDEEKAIAINKGWTLS